MWKCPRCGKSFQEEQEHLCGKIPETIEEYIDQQPEEAREYLKKINEVIRRAIPEAEERISWKMPTYWKKRNLVQFAAFKKHVGLYPGPQAVEQFSECLKEYKTSKGAIQFLYREPLPLELIEKIARWCADQP